MALTVTQASDIETFLDDCKAAILALPYADQLVNLSVAEALVAAGGALERSALGLPPRKSPLSLPQSRHLTLVGT